MRIAVLGAARSWYVGDLQRAAGAKHTIVPVDYRELRAEVGGTTPAFWAGDVDLTRCDALLVRSMPAGSLEQVVFRMNALAGVEHAGVQVVNPPRAIEIAVDKYLTTAKLSQAGFQVPPTVVCHTAAQALESYVDLGGDVVVKPIFGGEGRGLTRVLDEGVAHRVFHALQQIGAVLYLQRFIPHAGVDLRLLVIGERVWGMRRRHPHDWRTNISRGAIAEPLQITADLHEQALRAAAAVGAAVAGVDLLPGQDGQLYALEVNAVPGWRALARVAETDIAQAVLHYLEQASGP